MGQSTNTAVEQDESIGKVRELLFGSEIKKHKSDLQSLKTDFENKLNEFRKHFDSQIESVKNLVFKQNESLTHMIQKIESSSDEKYILTNKKIAEANDRNLKTFESISITQNKEFAVVEKILHSEIEKLSTDTQRDITHLREVKINKTSLAKFFQEAAENLQGKK